jgi:hypothetical protein
LRAEERERHFLRFSLFFPQREGEKEKRRTKGNGGLRGLASDEEKGKEEESADLKFLEETKGETAFPKALFRVQPLSFVFALISIETIPTHW